MSECIDSLECLKRIEKRIAGLTEFKDQTSGVCLVIIVVWLFMVSCFVAIKTYRRGRYIEIGETVIDL